MVVSVSFVVRHIASVRACALSAALLLTGCWGWIPEQPVPPEPAGVRPPDASPTAGGISTPALDSYTVVAGDTLFSIAWRFRLKVADLAAWNNLGDGSLILVDQRLRLSPPPGWQRTAAASSGSRPAAAGSSTAPKVGTGSAAAKAAAGNRPRSGGGKVVAGKPRSANTTAAPARSSAGSGSKPAKSAPAAAPAAVGTGKWRWPAQGRVDATGARVRSGDYGLRILGKRGQQVNAADSGTVMYAGDGLKAFGLLIIVQHSPEWLSAYGHNEKILVGEGEQVQAGQRIATMGTGPGNTPMLHFEIRRNGKPVEPRGLLPPRR